MERKIKKQWDIIFVELFQQVFAYETAIFSWKYAFCQITHWMNSVIKELTTVF